MLISPLYKNSLDFKNAYFCCWNQNIWGGLANIWGGLCPPGPNVEPPLVRWCFEHLWLLWTFHIREYTWIWLHKIGTLHVLGRTRINQQQHGYNIADCGRLKMATYTLNRFSIRSGLIRFSLDGVKLIFYCQLFCLTCGSGTIEEIYRSIHFHLVNHDS